VLLKTYRKQWKRLRYKPAKRMKWQYLSKKEEIKVKILDKDWGLGSSEALSSFPSTTNTPLKPLHMTL
jgi:hypothetical protein